MKVYKIRRKSDGLFSSGGIYPTFSSKGKSWKQLNHLNCHFSQFKPNAIVWGSMVEWPYDNCEIVEYEYELKEVNTIELQKMGSNKASD